MSKSSKHTLWILFLLGATPLVGCTTTRVLKRHTTKHATTAMDIHQQQVMDNLAKFVFDPHSMPSFSIASSGQTVVNDQATGGLSSLGFNNIVGFSSATVSMTGTRGSQQSWALSAVTDPRRLELMRCAYQTVVSNCGKGGVSADCPDCQKRFNRFYTGRTLKKGPWERLGKDGEVTDSEVIEALPTPSESECENRERNLNESVAFVFNRCEEEKNLVSQPGSKKGDGHVNSNCLSAGCCNWFGYGPKKCVPKGCDCKYVGHHCGLYVWVKPGCGREELAKLTLAILDYATHDPPTPRSKEVVLYRAIDAMGNEVPATKDTASKVVTVTVPTSELGENTLAYPANKNLLYPMVARTNDKRLTEVSEALKSSGNTFRFGAPIAEPENETAAGTPFRGDFQTAPLEAFQRFVPVINP